MYRSVPSPVTLLNETGVSFPKRMHFGRAMEGDRNFSTRLGYSGVNMSEVKESLGKFRAFIEG